MAFYQLIESKPKPGKGRPYKHIGDVDETGERSLIIEATTEIDARNFLARHFPDIDHSKGLHKLRNRTPWTWSNGLDMSVTEKKYRQDDEVYRV